MARKRKKKQAEPTATTIAKQAQGTTKALEAKVIEDSKLLLKAIKNLERRIVSEFASLKTSDLGNLMGPRVNLKKAQHLHKQLVKLFEEEYGKTVREQVAGYSEIAKWIERSFKDLGVISRFTDIDRTMINQLKKQTILEFLTVSTQVQNRITQALYNMVAASAPFDDLVKEVTGALIGHVDARGRPLTQYAELYVNDGIMNFYNSVHIEKGRQAGLRHMLYVGSVIKTTRDFCAKRSMKVYTIAQINSWTHDWAGKRGPALTYRGGWNCRHHWQAVKKDWIEKLAERYGPPVSAK